MWLLTSFRIKKATRPHYPYVGRRYHDLGQTDQTDQIGHDLHHLNPVCSTYRTQEVGHTSVDHADNAG